MISDDRRDHMLGVIFGHAIGDALGFGAEGLSKDQVRELFEGGLRDYGQVRSTGVRAFHRPGTWTDDTSQMLCILESLVEKRALDTKDVARKFYRWLVDDGFGVGQLVYTVLNSPDYLINPEATARRIWEEGQRHSAPNGAVMRTSVLGIWQHSDLDAVASNSARVCRLTHADPRCAASCVAVTTAIAAMLNGEPETDRVIAIAAESAAAFEPGSREFIDCGHRSLDDLDLDHGIAPGEENRIGYTYVALASAFWALARAESFEQGILAIINEGGDADTNAAVAGALLGAKFGFHSIPQRWIDNLVEHRYLRSECTDLLKAMEGQP